MVAFRGHVHRPHLQGRTVREFVICALWVSTLGGAAIDMLNIGGGEGVKATVIDGYAPEGALFGFLKELPPYGIAAPTALILIVVFFVTSSDSGSLVIDTITAGGKMDAPCGAACVLVHAGRSGRHRADTGWRACRTARGGGVNRHPVDAGGADHVLLPVVGTEV